MNATRDAGLEPAKKKVLAATGRPSTDSRLVDGGGSRLAPRHQLSL
jgi:hypothetical protein